MRRRSGSPLRIESLAGWVFADLMLVLFLVGLGTQVTHIVKAEPKPQPEPTVKVGMNEDPVIIRLSADADALLSGSKSDKAKEKQRLVNQILDERDALSGEQAAMTLIWGCGPTADVGQPLARAAGRQLEEALPEVFSGAAVKTLWDGWSDGSCQKGGIELEIYLYTTKPAD